MSSFVAVADLTGAPVAPAWLAGAASVRPYDAARVRVWADGAAGMAAAPLGARPAGLSIGLHPDGRAPVVVAFDGRLDDRAALVDALRRRHPFDSWRQACGPAASADAHDADLVRLAYLAWGADAAQRLLGDFAFCVWDGRDRRLVCARDHFGVRPLYYACSDRTLVISNAVDSLRRAGMVSSRLRDRAVGDLLLFGDPQEPGDTMLADVHRVPPAHVLTWAAPGGPAVRAYWRLQPPAPCRHGDAVASFREALQQAVHDRLRGESATVMMSGGLDSTSVAALTVQRHGAAPIRALTSVHRGLGQDQEERFAALAARALGIPWDAHPLDDYELFERWETDACPVLPMAEPLTAVMADLLDRATAHGSVALSGDGGDPLLLPATLPRHVGRMAPGEIARGVWRLCVRYRRPPLFGLRSTWRRLRTRDVPPPPWLAAPLRASYDAVARRLDVETAARVEPGVLRRESVRQLRAPWWPSLFESQHPAATRRPADVRYPFFDRRVVEAALSLPSYPWCVGKNALREAMVDRLPDPVRLRPKTPFAADPVAIRRRASLEDVVRTLRSAPAIEPFVDVERFAATVRPAGLLLDDEPGTLAAMSLALWLTHAPEGS